MLARLRPERVARSTSPNSGSADRAIGQLRAVVDEWKRRGRPAQPPIGWPRARWLGELPEHRTLLESIPDLLDRAAVAAVGRVAAESPTRAIEALVAVMAWGQGVRGYARHRTREILAAPGLDALLYGVARATVDGGALAGYGRLASIRRVGLGPSFGTKFLYFAQPADARPRALIHDRVIAGWLIEVAACRSATSPMRINATRPTST